MPPLEEGTPMTQATTDQPTLKRSLGGFQVFAISFAFISVAVGIFATYGQLLNTAGPVGIWLWIVAAVGQGLVALVVAQFASRIALSGSSYQWASRLANPRIGWFFGWLSFWYLAIAVVTMANAMASQALMPLLGMDADEAVARILTIVILVVQAALVIASTRLFGLITSAAVGVELGIIAILVVALLIVMAVTGGGDVGNLTDRGPSISDPNYFAIGGGLMAGALLGLTTLVGFDSAANLAEEAKNPYRNVPRAIVGSVIAASVAGMRLPDRAHGLDQGCRGRQRRRVAGRRHHPRPARAGLGADHHRRHRLRVLRRRPGRDGGLRSPGLRDGARRALPGIQAHEPGEPTHAHSDRRDRADRADRQPRSWSCSPEMRSSNC